MYALLQGEGPAVSASGVLEGSESSVAVMLAAGRYTRPGGESG